MASIYERRTFGFTVAIKDLSTSLETIMQKLWSFKNNYHRRSLCPTLIGIDVAIDTKPETLRALRMFFKALREVQQKHFVRFVTDFLWTMETDCIDLFYTHDGNKRDWCDVSWRIKVLDAQHVEVSVSAPLTTDYQVTMHKLCRQLMPPIPGTHHQAEDEELYAIMSSFYKENSIFKEVDKLQTQCHIVLIPNDQHDQYLPVPIYGLTYENAARKYKKAVQEINFLQQQHFDVLEDFIEPEDIFCNLLALIQEEEQFGTRRRSAQTAYGLAELMLGWYGEHNTSAVSSHDMLIITKPNDEDVLINTLRLSLKDLEEIG